MPGLYVVRRPKRWGLNLRMKGQGDGRDVMFLLSPKLENAELDELVRAVLEKQGVTGESRIQAAVDRAETEYEQRIKVAEAKQEVRRLMRLRAEGAKLMSAGFRKWKQAFYPLPPNR